MDDSVTIGLIIGLFALNYAGTWAVYKKVNSFTIALRILCREHKQHHGETEIEIE